MATDTQSLGTEKAFEEPRYSVLAAAHEAPCISIFAHDGASVDGQAKQTFIRFKKLLQAAEANLSSFSMTVAEAEELLTSHWNALRNKQPTFPGAQTMAVFVSKDFFGRCYLPVEMSERIVVGREFFLRPLLPFVPTNDKYFVLALSQKHVKLFEGSRRSIRERAIHEVPDNFREDLKGLSFERHYQMHTASSPSAQQKGAVYHGPSLEHKDRLIHFFRDVDRGVATSLEGEQSPLIVASVDYLFPIYKEANSYPHLMEDFIGGNPDLLSPYALHAASWRIMEKHLAEAKKRAFSVYGVHANTSRTSSNLRKVVGAAERGGVRFLFIATEGERWGLLADPETVHVHEQREPGDVELLNLAAVLAIRTGGQVFAVPRAELPEGADVAAVFRY